MTPNGACSCAGAKKRSDSKGIMGDAMRWAKAKCSSNKSREKKEKPL